MKKQEPIIFYSLAEIHEVTQSADREQTLADIASGKTEFIEFNARVFKDGQNKNFVRFRENDMPAFAHSFKNAPFLRNHDTHNIESRDGTTKASEFENSAMMQTIRLTTRKGMTAYVEGQIDRFSIGWRAEKTLCSICGNDYGDYSKCQHIRGRQYENKYCELIMVNPKGIETSAVNDPAVDGTGILQSMDSHKLEVIGDSKQQSKNAVARKPLTKGGQIMPKKVKVKVTDPETLEVSEIEGEAVDQSPLEAQLDANRQAAAELLGETQRQQAMDAQLQASQDVLIATCEHLLTVGLASSKLPPIVQTRIRKQFEGKAFKAVELQSAISEARDEVTALTSADNVQGPGRIGAMYNVADDFALAVADMFGLPREAGKENRKVFPLQGMRDAYLKATGDQYFTGGYFPEFSLVSANFPGIVANVQNKMLTDAWKDFEESYGWWQTIVTIEHFTNLKTATWVRTGTIASLPSVAERGEYPELPIGDAKETSEWGKYGGYVPLTIESVINDDLRAFRRMPSEVALAGIRNISEQVAAIFTMNSGAGPTMSDGGALFNATAQTSAGGHINLLTTALGTDYTAWKAAALAMYKKKLMVKNAAGVYGTGKPQALKPSICLVPADLIDSAEALFIPRWEANAQNVPATQSVRWGGRVRPIAVPEWTDATDWAALIDPKLRPGIMLGEIFGVKPQIFSASSEIDPAMFANDESRLKVRQFVTVGVADDLPLHKSNVAG